MMNKPGQRAAPSPLWGLGFGLLWRPQAKAPPFGRGSFTVFSFDFPTSTQSRKGRFAFHDIHPQMRQCQCQDQASFNVNVAGLLRQMLRAKSLIINNVADVADFSDLHINLAIFAFPFQMANFIQLTRQRNEKQ